MDLLGKDGSVTIHTRKLQILATEMFKVPKNLSTELMQGLFCVRKIHYHLRNPDHFAIPSVNSVNHGSERISNLGPRIWNLVPDGLNELNSTCSFLNEIKRLKDCNLKIVRVGSLRPIYLIGEKKPGKSD